MEAPTPSRKKVLTNIFIVQDGKMLLGMKKRGFGQGRWNGFGGKLAEGESLVDAARRELREEASIELKELTEEGVITFDYSFDNKIYEVHFFRGSGVVGTPVASDEMEPKWFGLHEIPLESMWPNDRHWIPLFLANKKFSGDYIFSDYDTITSYDLRETKAL